MFESFTAEARQAMADAQDGARRLRHDYIGTEHLLLGLAADPTAGTAAVLDSLGASRAYVRDEIIRIVGRGPIASPPEIPLSPRAKRALELSSSEARGTGHPQVGTEHVLLGIIREGGGVGMQILTEGNNSDADAIRAAVMRRLEERDAPPPPPPAPTAPAERGDTERAGSTEARGAVTAGGVAARARVASSASFSVLPDPELRLTLMRAAARALAEGRESYGVADLLAVIDPDVLPGPDRA